MGGLFTFALVAVFAVLALLVAVVGVQAYQSVLDTTERNNETRMSLSYFINKVRAGDSYGYIHIDEYDGNDMLVFDHNYDGEEYQTRIYYYDGAIYEQFTSMDDDEFYPDYGEYLISSVSSFEVEIDPSGLMALTVIFDGDEESEGEAYTVHVAVRTMAQRRG